MTDPSRDRAPRHRLAAVLLVAVFGSLAGCASDQVQATAQVKAIGLRAGDLEAQGLAFITPSSVTGQEEDRQALALVVGEVLKERRPEVRAVTLPEVLSAVNRAGLADDYRRMLSDYRETGIFRRDCLHELSELTGVRYVAQLKLAGFGQESQERWSIIGFRVFQTLRARIRLFLQIWDAREGVIVWEGMQEVNFAYDTSKERPVTFGTVVKVAAQEMIGRLP